MSNWLRARHGGGGWDDDDDDRSWYDGMQVCVNGHRITDSAKSQPEHRQDFCAHCGARTITTCESCQAEIRGYYHVPGVISAHTTPVPKYCIKCGEPYPWQKAAIENLKDVLREGGLGESDLQTVDKVLPDIVRETPRTESASLRFKAIAKKLGKDAYGIAIKVATDVASETAKKMLGLP